jgi:uncharacterized membrane protein YphA (DoxX/SURF4 family)
MQRLFSVFPAGRPGFGLLLLRAAAGLALAVQGAQEAAVAASLAGRSAGTWQWAAAAAAIATSTLLLVGLLTPLAGALAALDAFGAVLGWLPPWGPALRGPATLFVGVMAVALCLLGPGAFSLDAHWFGRREVVIPPPPG